MLSHILNSQIVSLKRKGMSADMKTAEGHLPQTSRFTCPSTHWEVHLLFHRESSGVMSFLAVSLLQAHNFLFCHSLIHQSTLK